MNEREMQQLKELIAKASKAKGQEYEAACGEIGKLIMRHCSVEPLVLHNTDSWSDEMLEAI